MVCVLIRVYTCHGLELESTFRDGIQDFADEASSCISRLNSFPKHETTANVGVT